MNETNNVAVADPVLSQGSQIETEPELGYVSISELFNKSLKIPDYQRPYRWQHKHVLQLLEDIARNFRGGKFYRVGTVILHDFDIVDGQQRLVTLTLILHFLKNDIPNRMSLPLLSGKFPHHDSEQNILENYKAIKGWFYNFDSTAKKDFAEYILNKCQLVEIVLRDLSEAFQLFDSQNARGKALEPYDLLKAFHLREMSNETSDNRKLCVRSWEEAVNDGLLNNLGKHIFRIRRWARGERPGEFNKDDIGEFKGISINKAGDYPYMRSYIINEYFLQEMCNNSFSKVMGVRTDFPFRLTQPVVNGKFFFKMVEHYNKIFSNLFVKDGPTKVFFDTHCRYSGSHRIGDRYVQELFQALILCYYDKFGEEDLDKAAKTLYKWAYRLRLMNGRVFYSSVDKYVSEDNLYKALEQSYFPYETISKQVSLPETVKMNISHVVNQFETR